MAKDRIKSGYSCTTTWFWRLTCAFKATLFPHRCLGCDAFFSLREPSGTKCDVAGISVRIDHFKHLITPFLCSKCRNSIKLLQSPFCRICGMPFESRAGDDHTCGACIQSPKRFDLARSCGYYENGLKDLIHWFKYHEVPHLAQPLGALLAWGFLKYFRDQIIDLIIPVPLHPKRMRSRGFNQAYLLTRAAVKDKLKQKNLTELPDIAAKTLIRIRATPPQTGLGREHRRKNIRNAFAVTHFELIKDRSILLVDDVYTTGATVDECARMLKNAGAGRVSVLSLARAV